MLICFGLIYKNFKLSSTDNHSSSDGSYITIGESSGKKKLKLKKTISDFEFTL